MTKSFHWGLLGIDSVQSIRRTRTLNVGSVVRMFNQLAVPGMGNVRFCKQIFLAALGIAVAEEARKKNQRVKNIEVANAIEAIGSRLSFEEYGWTPDPRLRGLYKLRTKKELIFAEARKKSFYVTQPMRMACVQALPAIGITTNNSVRFNIYQLTNEGKALIDRICEDYGQFLRQKNLIDYLVYWIQGKDEILINNDRVYNALSPLEKLSKSSRKYIETFVLQNSADEFSRSRRQAIFKWVEELRIGNQKKWDWNKKPKDISEEHWNDLKSGSMFFKTRDLALDLLNKLEGQVNATSKNKIKLNSIDLKLKNEKYKLKLAAQSFLDNYQTSTKSDEAIIFINECLDDLNVIKNMVIRDGIGLRLRGNDVIPGSAFKGDLSTGRSLIDEDEDIDNSISDYALPDNISGRVKNMFYLNIDLKGELDKWL